MSRSALTISFLGWLCLSGLVVGCSLGPQPTESVVELRTTGHLDATFRKPDGNLVGVGDHLASGSQHHPDRNGFDLTQIAEMYGSLTGTFTVKQAGLITFTVEELKREQGSGRFAGSWPIKRALFLVSAPAGAAVVMSITPELDPTKVQLELDHNADGVVDEELTPVAVAADDELPESLPPSAKPSATPIGSNEWQVSFAGPDDPSSIKGIVYAVFPGQSELQIYRDPFVVPAGSFILYSAFDESGVTQPTEEFLVSDGTFMEITEQIAVNGRPHEVWTTEMGQTVTLSFEGKAGQDIQLAVGVVAGRGVEPCCMAELSLQQPDGSFMIFPTNVGQRTFTKRLSLTHDGTYTMHLDPYLDNTIVTTVTLTETKAARQ